MTLAEIVLQMMNGLTIAAIYILLASGLTIVLGLQGIVNAAHGVFYMLGAYLAITLISKIGLNFWLTLPVAFVANFLLGVVLESLGVRTLQRWKRPSSHQMILTIGFALFVIEIIKVIWGTVPQMLAVPPYLQGTISIGSITYPKYWLFVILSTTAFMVILFLFFNWTGVGTLVRSVAINNEVSQALGTNAPRLNTQIFGLGTGIAGVAGVLAAPLLGVDTNMGFELLIILFVVIIFGGLGSLVGVVVSGIIIGEVMAFGAALISGMIAKIVVFALMIVILIIRPLGMFGRGAAIE